MSYSEQSSYNVIAIARKYLTAGKDKKRLLDELMSIENGLLDVYEEVYTSEARACLRILADASRRKQGREALHDVVVRDADKLVALKDAKARKTAYALIGECAPDECAAKLKAALDTEKTRFAIPSIILALGNTTDPAAYLDDYEVKPGEEKHMREESDALKKALSKTAPKPKRAKLALPKVVTLTWINRTALVEEIREKGVKCQKSKRISNAVVIETANIPKLRCYEIAMFYIGSTADLQSAAKMLDAMRCKGLAYRIEAGSIDVRKRRERIDEISQGLRAYGYTDNPSAYAFEIRVHDTHLYVRLPIDQRFSYRKKSISASIHPVTAACVMQLCKPYMSEKAHVLDAFCGSGTLLIERSKAMGFASLTGVDISAQALKAATENRNTARVKIALTRRDILKYDAAQHDEIYANMPFGIRVSDHESNVLLYQNFAVRLPNLLKENGHAFLYTQEKKLLVEEISKHNGLEIVKEIPFESGGLSPTLFIIKRR